MAMVSALASLSYSVGDLKTNISMLISGMGSFTVTVRSSLMSGIGDGTRVGFTPCAILPNVRSSSGITLSESKSPESTSPMFDAT